MREGADNRVGMSGTRALFTSIGASVLLVGAAALSLLAVSAVFAFGGWSDPVAESSRQTALVLAGGADGRTRAAGQEALVLPRRANSRPARGSVSTAPSQASISGGGRSGIARSARSRPPKASFPTPSEPQAATPQAPSDPSTPSAPKPTAAGDGVRTAGENLSGGVQNTADALAKITDPLLPPVTAATQKVLNLVAELLRRSTDGLGGAVDGLLAPR